MEKSNEKAHVQGKGIRVGKRNMETTILPWEFQVRSYVHQVSLQVVETLLLPLLTSVSTKEPQGTPHKATPST